MLPYSALLTEVKARIHRAQTKAIFAVNSQLLMLYWEIGRLLISQQSKAGWGARVLRKLSNDIRRDLPELKGFSVRNLELMTQFFREYPEIGILHGSKYPNKRDLFTQQLVAQLPWGHNILLIQKLKNLKTRAWYMREAAAQGWSKNVLQMMIESAAHKRQGSALSNFESILPAPQSDLAQRALNDPYIFDFLTLAHPIHERQIEAGLIQQVEKFLLELGQGFAFVGRQYHLELGDEDFYIDLLFYHLKLHCYVVVELKTGSFKPEYLGKLTFYLNVIDARLKESVDGPSIGLILCQEKNKLVAEYALRTALNPVGISEYKCSRILPDQLQSSLPSVEDIEVELSRKRR